MRRLDIRDVGYWVSTFLRGINVFSLIRKLWIILALEKIPYLELSYLEPILPLRGLFYRFLSLFLRTRLYAVCER